MKKFLILLSILLALFIAFIVYDTIKNEKIPKLKIEEDVVSINEIYIYGTHLNMEGSYNFSDNAEFVLYNGDFYPYDINILNDENSSLFNFSKHINDGIYLDDIPVGKYYMFLRVKDNSVTFESEEERWKYYSLKNTSDYQNTSYYSMSKYEKKIVIENEDSYPTMMMDITKIKNEDVYDIVIDPGHGGRDGGANAQGYKETDFTLDLSTRIKQQLELEGFKVKLTHEIGELSKEDKLDEYGVHGRAVIPREVNAKYLFSIHLNSSSFSSVSGLEVYTAKNINYDFAKILVNNLITETGLKYSNNKINKIYDGIYSRNFTKDDVKSSIKDYEKKELNAYDITTNANYYYMIRETGGIITGAYVDNRNASIIGNPYVNSNIGTEAYLLELGYISNNNDLKNMINNKDKYVNAIVNSIKTLYKED